MISRRRLLPLLAAAPLASQSTTRLGYELTADLVIIGGSLGGCAAALAALRNGLRVILTESTDWVGGQITSQITPPDEHRYVERFGSTQLYRDFRNAIRDYYRRHYPLTTEALRDPLLSPGGGTVNYFTCEPRAALAVLEAMLAPYLSTGKLRILLETDPTAADTARDTVRSVTVRDREGRTRTLTAPYFIDATEQGDLLPLTKTEFVTGFESRRVTGEPHAPLEAQPANLQSNTVCFAFDYRADEDHTIDRPANYNFWRDYVPKLKPAWPGKLFSLTYSNPRTLQPRFLRFDPTDPRTKGENLGNFWTYRRIFNGEIVQNGSPALDISVANWPQNDYLLGNFLEDSAKAMQAASELSLCLFYWLQTEAPREEGNKEKLGWPGLRLRPDITGTATGLAKAAYIREGRRIQAEFTVCEQHVSTAARAGYDRAEPFFDSVGIGTYRIDLHPSTGGDNYIDISSLPFQIPLGALIPRRIENLIPACKNIGTTHVTNGCYRLHPVEWNIGEAAGELAAEAIRIGSRPRQIRANRDLLTAFQKQLVAKGIEIAWPQLTPR
jgi:hypothetical protein